jgi:multiple sugar transport system ATP-binding protein
MATVELKNVSKHFGGFAALTDINFDTRDGEFFFILGPSGAGKSTIFNIISGLLPISAGDVFIDGNRVNDLQPRFRDVAVAYESYALYPNKTVFENLAFPLRAPIRRKDYTEEQIRKTVRGIAELLQIDEFLDRLPSQLSGGQKQRVSLGRTLVRRPKVYLLDEPIAHLDAKLRHRMRGELKRLQKELGVSAIFATPDQLEAVSMADRVIVIDRGVTQQIGAPEDLYFRPKNVFVAEHVGEPKINLLKGTIAVEGGRTFLAFGALRLEVPADGDGILSHGKLPREVLIGIRPSNFTISSGGGEGVRGKVIFKQISGDVQVIKVAIEGTELTVKAEMDEIFELGDILGLKLRNSRIHVFDPDNGAAL